MGFWIFESWPRNTFRNGSKFFFNIETLFELASRTRLKTPTIVIVTIFLNCPLNFFKIFSISWYLEDIFSQLRNNSRRKLSWYTKTTWLYMYGCCWTNSRKISRRNQKGIYLNDSRSLWKWLFSILISKMISLMKKWNESKKKMNGAKATNSLKLFSQLHFWFFPRCFLAGAI